VWVLPKRIGTSQGIFHANSAASNNEFGLQLQSSGALRVLIDSGSGVPLGNKRLAANQWAHVVVRRSGSKIDLYVDSQFDATATDGDALNFGSCPFLIGADQNNTTCSAALGEFFDGPIDDVRIWNRALSPDEIRRLYKMGSTLHINSTISNDSLKTGLVGHWTFDGKDMLATTTVIGDASGNGSKGIAQNGARPVLGRLGQAFSFDGSNDYINLGNPSSLQLTGAMTVSAWVYDDKSPTQLTYGRVISKFGSSPQRGWELNKDYSPLSYFFAISSNGTTMFNVSYPVQPDDSHKWIHWVGVYEPGVALRLYKNGTLVNSNTTSIPASQFNSSQNVNIGRWPTAGADTNGYWLGKIDDVRIYNRALSPDEIKRLYNMGR
jgi:hypothetical protein